jgi:esterase/lipase
MKDEIKTYFSDFLSLESEDLETFMQKLTLKQFAKGDRFIKEGEVCTEIGFVLIGCLDNASPVEISKNLMKKFKTNVEIKVFENSAHWMMEEKNREEISKFIKNG